MIGRRTLWEVFHVLLGVVGAFVIAALCAWSYPLAETDIWIVAGVAMAVTVVMGIPAIRRAMAEDDARKAGE